MPTPVSPRWGRDCRFFVATLLRMTAREQFVQISRTLNSYLVRQVALCCPIAAGMVGATSGSQAGHTAAKEENHYERKDRCHTH